MIWSTVKAPTAATATATNTIAPAAEPLLGACPAAEAADRLAAVRRGLSGAGQAAGLSPVTAIDPAAGSAATETNRVRMIIITVHPRRKA